MVVDPRARWGILLVFISYALIWFGPFWLRRSAPWRIPVATVFLVLSVIVSWTAVRALGRQWRMDAGLNADHELVHTGPYRFMRHPIYTSMLLQLIGTGVMISIPWLVPIALVFFIIGTEIRIRIEEKLLAAQFPQEFAAYRRATPAYIPFMK